MGDLVLPDTLLAGPVRDRRTPRTRRRAASGSTSILPSIPSCWKPPSPGMASRWPGVTSSSGHWKPARPSEATSIRSCGPEKPSPTTGPQPPLRTGRCGCRIRPGCRSPFMRRRALPNPRSARPAPSDTTSAAPIRMPGTRPPGNPLSSTPGRTARDGRSRAGDTPGTASFCSVISPVDASQAPPPADGPGPARSCRRRIAARHANRRHPSGRRRRWTQCDPAASWPRRSRVTPSGSLYSLPCDDYAEPTKQVAHSAASHYCPSRVEGRRVSGRDRWLIRCFRNRAAVRFP